MEGVASEAASLAGHLGLGKLVYLYLDNKITIEGATDLTFTEDVRPRFNAYNWHVQHIDGNDQKAFDEAMANAQAETSRPSLIIARTCIGCGSPNKENTPDAHGAPLGAEEVKLTKKNLDWPLEPDFYVPEDVRSFFRQALDRGAEAEKAWSEMFTEYQKQYPELAAQWKAMREPLNPDVWKESLPLYEPEKGSVATRKASGQALPPSLRTCPALSAVPPTWPRPTTPS